MTADSPGRQTHYRWVICSLLFFATTINYLDRQILALLKDELSRRFEWDNTTYGTLQGCFKFAYGFGVLGFGWFIDRFGIKIGYTVSIIAWSIAAAAHSLVGSVTGFVGVRLAMGVGEGGNFPGAISATARWFPRRQRALATALFNSGANVGACLGPAIVPLVAYRFGWQCPFVIGGIAGFVWLLAWVPLYDDPERSRYTSVYELAVIHADTPAPAPNAAAVVAVVENPVPWSQLLVRPQAWSFVVAKLLTEPVWDFFLFWLPDFFRRVHGLDVMHSRWLLVSIYGLITVPSIFGGWLPGLLHGRGWSMNSARKTSLGDRRRRDASGGVRAVPVGVAGRVHFWFSRRGPPGVVGESVFDFVGHVPQAGDRPAGRPGHRRRRGQRDGLPLRHRVDAGPRRSRLRHPAAGLLSIAYLIAFGLNHLLAPRFEMLPAAGSNQ